MQIGLLDIVKAYIAYTWIHNEIFKYSDTQIFKYLKNKSQFSKINIIFGISGPKLPYIHSNITATVKEAIFKKCSFYTF